MAQERDREGQRHHASQIPKKHERPPGRKPQRIAESVEHRRHGETTTTTTTTKTTTTTTTTATPTQYEKQPRGRLAHRRRENHRGEEAHVAEMPQGVEVLGKTGGEHHSQGHEKHLKTKKTKKKKGGMLKGHRIERGYLRNSCFSEHTLAPGLPHT